MKPRTTRTTRSLPMLLLAGGLAIGSMACSSSSPTSTANSSTTAAPGSTAGPGGGASGDGKIAVTFSSKGCDPAKVEAKAGQVTLAVTNKGDETGEFEILQGGKIKGEAENIAPNFPTTITATLDAGTYELICGESTFPKGSLVVT